MIFNHSTAATAWTKPKDIANAKPMKIMRISIHLSDKSLNCSCIMDYAHLV